MYDLWTPLPNRRLVLGRENTVDTRISAAEESVCREVRGQSTKLMENRDTSTKAEDSWGSKAALQQGDRGRGENKASPEGHSRGHFQGQEVKCLYQVLPTVGRLNIFHFS